MDPGRDEGTPSFFFSEQPHSLALTRALLSCKVIPEECVFTEIPVQQGTSQNARSDQEILVSALNTCPAFLFPFHAPCSPSLSFSGSGGDLVEALRDTRSQVKIRRSQGQKGSGKKTCLGNKRKKEE